MAGLLERRIAPALALAQAGLALAVLRWGVETPIPMHFNWQGEADRFGDRREAAAIIAAMAVLSLAGPLLLRPLSNRRASRPDGFSEAVLVLLGVSLMVCGLAAGLGLGLLSADHGPHGAMTFVSALLAVTGAYLGKVGPNALVGVRTPWTFASRLAWDKSNRLAGRLFFWIGVAGFVVAPFAPQPAGLQAFTGLIVGAAALAVFESWRVWRTDPDRTSSL